MSPPDLLPDRPHPQSSSTLTLAPASAPSNPPTPISLREQVKRGWDWVVFVWQMLRRMGGPLDLLLAIWTVISVLVTRFLIGLGVIKK